MKRHWLSDLVLGGSRGCRLAERRRKLVRCGLPERVESLDARVMLSADMAGLIEGLPAVSGFVASSDVSSSSPALTIDSTGYDTSRILVRFRSEVSTMQASQVVAGTKLADNISLVPGLRVVELNDGVSIATALEAYQSNPEVLFAEPDFRVQIDAVPSDPQFGALWGMHNTGQTGGTADADIDAVEAWDVTTGTGANLVAVIDTGIDYTHRDLAANIWTNTDEVPGNGRDDDNNGYVDDVHGYDFVNNDGDPMDDHSHGTHVAGTIGALANNGTGVAGVNHRTKLVGVKFLSSGGSGYISDALRGLDYSIVIGASISNNSWGGGGFSQSFYEGLTRARAAGHIFVAAAGNSHNNNDTNPFYPAGYDLDNVVAVAATDHRDQLASFSNYGRNSVDLGAPGVNILSTTPNNSYATYSGTSMASPHAAGVISLVRDQHPEWTYRQVIDRVVTSGDPIPALSGKTVSGKRLNAAAAVQVPDGSIAGVAFVDQDGDGVRDTDEPGDSGRVIWIDSDGDGERDASEKSVTTDSAGRYDFRELASGTQIVRMESQAGRTVTSPALGFHRVVMGGGERVTDRDFGSTQRALPAGTALAFDGTDDFVITPTTKIMNGLPLTAEAWVKPELRSDGTDFPNNTISNDQPGRAGHGFGLNVWSGGSQLKVQYQHGFRNVPGVTFTAGQWYHVAIVYTPGNYKAYVGDKLVDDYSFTQDVLDGVDFIRIGKHNDDGGYGTRRFFMGSLDEVRLWNTPRTKEQIAADMRRPLAGTETGLVGYWRFDEGSGTAVADRTSSGNHGTLGGGAAQARPQWMASNVPFELSRTVGMGQHEGFPGGTVRVPVVLSEAAGVQSADLTILYDTTLLDVRPEDIRLGDLTAGWQLTTNVSDANGTIRVSAFGTTPLPAGSGNLIEVDFAISPSAPLDTTTTLRLPDVKLNEGQIPATPADGLLRIIPATMQVTSFVPNYSGFSAQFNRDLDLAVLNLNQGQTRQGASDAVINGAANGVVPGSITWDAATRTMWFVKTGGMWLPDAYSITLASRADGFRDTTGELLDGNRDGQPGGDFTFQFSVNSHSLPIVSLPDVSRGPGQAVNVPASATGLPLHITNGAGAQSLDFELHFNAAQLAVTGVGLAAGMPGDWQVTSNSSQPGVLRVSAFGTQPLPAGARDLLIVQANVPDTAAYGSSQALRIVNLRLNEGGVPVVGDNAFHQVTFIGDATGNRGYSGLDASLISRIAVGLDTGFDAFPVTDPVVVADVTQNGSLSGQDAALVAAKAAGRSVPEIPDIAGQTVTVPSVMLANVQAETSLVTGAVTLPSATLRAGSSQTLSVPARAIEGLQSADLVIEFDPRAIALTAADLSLGNLVSGSWSLTSNVDTGSGRLRATLFSTEPLANGTGELLRLQVTVPADAASGSTSLRLVEAAWNEGRREVATTDGALSVSNPADSRVRMYRAYNPNADFHFFTTSRAQFDNAVVHGYRDETTNQTGFSVLAEATPGSTPIYRLYNLERGFHYYTLNRAERDYLVSLVPSNHPRSGQIGWRDEGVEGMMFNTSTADTSLVYRLYNTNSGVHLFTHDATYKNAVLAKFPGVWVEHNPLGYAFAESLPSGGTQPLSSPPATASASRNAASIPIARVQGSVSQHLLPRIEDQRSVVRSVTPLSLPAIEGDVDRLASGLNDASSLTTRSARETSRVPILNERGTEESASDEFWTELGDSPLEINLLWEPQR